MCHDSWHNACLVLGIALWDAFASSQVNLKTLFACRNNTNIFRVVFFEFSNQAHRTTKGEHQSSFSGYQPAAPTLWSSFLTLFSHNCLKHEYSLMTRAVLCDQLQCQSKCASTENNLNFQDDFYKGSHLYLGRRTKWLVFFVFCFLTTFVYSTQGCLLRFVYSWRHPLVVKNASLAWTEGQKAERMRERI